MGQEGKEDDEERERGMVNREGSHDVPESRGAWGGGITGGDTGSEDSPGGTENSTHL